MNCEHKDMDTSEYDSLLDECPLCLLDEIERLKAFIVHETDNMAAFAPFDEMGNMGAFVRRAYHSVGDLIPELKVLLKEVDDGIELAINP